MRCDTTTRIKGHMLLHYVCGEQLFREHIGCLGPASYMLWVFIRDGSLSRYLSPVPSFGTLQNLDVNGTTPLATHPCCPGLSFWTLA